MAQKMYPTLCEAAKKTRAALAMEGYRVGWQLATDPQSEYRPHYVLTGYVGPGGVLLVQDFFDPGEPTTDAVEVYAPICDSSMGDAIAKAIRERRPKHREEPRLGDGSHVPMPGDPGDHEE